MIGFRNCVEAPAGSGPRFVDSGVAVDEAIGRLEAGEAPSAVVTSPLHLAAAIALAALNVDDHESSGLPLVQARPRRPRLIGAVGEAALEGVAPEASRPARLALAAGLLQLLESWDASHEAAQEADDLGEKRFSPYWHGIAHRREPDAGNASYWFRRVGKHPIYPALAEAARPILDEHGDRALADRLAGPGGWDPYAMIELCTRAKPGSAQERLARRLQSLEMTLLLEATAEAAAGRPPG